jgi:hypothetical protein
MTNDEFGMSNGRNFVIRTSAFELHIAYHNRAISTMQVIEELIKLAKDLDAATKRGEDMGLAAKELKGKREAGETTSRDGWVQHQGQVFHPL